MKIHFSSYHRYPGRLYGVASHSVHDNIVKGLSELGHEVWYSLKEPPEVPLPEGVIYTPDRIKDADIYHINNNSFEDLPEENIPWVKVVHCDVRIQGYELDLCQDNWIYVSKTLAKLYDSERYVRNGINPAEFIYSDVKDDYLFFLVGGLGRAEMKGLEMAMTVAEKTGTKLKIAGTSNDPVELEKFGEYCKSRGVTFCGPVHGQKKAELFAGAKAVLFPSKYNEACPLVIAEALMSGTPVISSDNGACPELLTNKVGFVCHEELDYLKAIDNIDSIQNIDCRNYALENFHYLRMAEQYAEQYEFELGKEYASI